MGADSQDPSAELETLAIERNPELYRRVRHRRATTGRYVSEEDFFARMGRPG
jgi:hypothetical protein